MNAPLEILIGIIILILGFPLGDRLAKMTKEELKSGRRWFQFIIFAGVIGSVLSIIFRNDALLFTFLFIIIIVSRSLKNKK